MKRLECKDGIDEGAWERGMTKPIQTQSRTIGLTADTITNAQIEAWLATATKPSDVVSHLGANDPHAVSLVDRARKLMRDDAILSEGPLRKRARGKIAEILNLQLKGGKHGTR